MADLEPPFWAIAVGTIVRVVFRLGLWGVGLYLIVHFVVKYW